MPRENIFRVIMQLSTSEFVIKSIPQMPFAHFHYRCIRKRNYGYSKRVCRFIAVCLAYTITCAILGGVFLGLYLEKQNYLNSLNCPQACAWVDATTSCGHQLCCNNVGISYSFQYCTNAIGLGDYFLLFIILFGYAGYELILMICILCRGSAFYDDDDVVIVEQYPQYSGLNSYQNQQIYQANNQMSQRQYRQ